MKPTQFTFHLLAILIVIIWGITFVSTKVLMLHGLTPAAIFAIRFAIAYVFMLALSHRRIFCSSWRDELLMMALGLTGGSMYFLTENLSLAYTTTTNTSLIVCSCPLFATMLICAAYRQRLEREQLMGAFFAFLGMATVVMNGHFVLHLSPLGDALAFSACLCWAVYSAIIRLVVDRYSAAFINRKTFIYGFLSILPWFLFKPEEVPSVSQLMDPLVASNLAFLCLVASVGCFCLWTVCIRRLGVIAATNYVYLNPISTMVVAFVVLGEVLTPWFFLGSFFILLGLYLHNYRKG